MSHLVGLTGGIASGKSTVANYLRKLGYPVIDADQLVHELQQKGGLLYQTLVLSFGTGILQADGQLDRKKLGQLIFSSPENQEKSAQLQNRIIRQELAKKRDQFQAREDVVFMDIPLLFELDYQSWFEEVWLVFVSPQVQLERLQARNGYSLEEAQQRIAAQFPLEKKQALADRLIDNNGSLEATYAQVDELLARLTAL